MQWVHWKWEQGTMMWINRALENCRNICNLQHTCLLNFKTVKKWQLGIQFIEVFVQFVWRAKINCKFVSYCWKFKSSTACSFANQKWGDHGTRRKGTNIPVESCKSWVNLQNCKYYQTPTQWNGTSPNSITNRPITCPSKTCCMLNRYYIVATRTRK